MSHTQDRSMHGAARLIASVTILALVAACGESATAPAGSGLHSSGPCTPSTATTLSVGQVLANVAGSSICLAGGSAGADYALVAHNGSTTPSAVASFTLTASGTQAALASAALASRAPATDIGMLASSDLSEQIDARLRETERRALLPLVPGARQLYGARQWGGGPLRDVIPSTVSVGQLLRLNANGDSACADPTYRVGRVVAVTRTAIVVADTSNPAGGFTDADYQSIGVTFDTLINPLDTRYFGQPTDIDHNGHVLLFFTSAVNAMTPPHSSSYVGGFFFARDLFPQTGTSTMQGCAGSNYGEMFYLLVPDPNGTVNGNSFTTAKVTQITIGTTAHEYQHLINAARRLYINNAAEPFEEVWLNEGLSHSAEELLFYRVSGLAPRQNLDATALRASPMYVNAFNSYAIDNFRRYELFLEQPSSNSPYAANDSLATRGATWSFLRYAADHQSGTDSAFFYRLVNSTTAGIANLQQVIGAALPDELRGWATSVFTDDEVATAAPYQQPSWNFRAIYPALSYSSFPLRTIALANGTSTAVSVNGGGTAYLRLGVAAGQAGGVTWGTLPASVQLTLVRTR